VRIYLNTSALNQPFDNLSSRRIRQEAEAITMVVSAVEARQASLVGSEYLVFEIRQNPDPERGQKILTLLRLARAFVKMSPRVAARASQLERFGLRGLDALHVASAEAGRVDLLVTTDDRMLRRCRRAGARLSVRVVPPLEALAAPAEEVRE